MNKPRKLGSGGKRPGTGQPKKDNPKKTVTIRLRDDQKKSIITTHGSLQKGIDWLANQCIASAKK
jgi:hypothetical protein